MTTTLRSGPAASRHRKVRRTYRLAPAKVAAAKRALDAATDTEAIERALDLVVFRRELIEGTHAMLGVRLESPDPER